MTLQHKQILKVHSPIFQKSFPFHLKYYHSEDVNL